MAKLRALLVGATGIAGQQFVSALRDHPWFEIGAIAASPRNAGKRYDEAVAGAWFLPEAIPAEVAAMRLQDPGAPARGVDLVFSAVESDVARELEPRLAAELPVVSAASTFRMEADVPLLIPPVNAPHAGLVAAQRARGWRGWVAPIPNCTATGLAVVLAPLAERFGVRSAIMTSLQAVSGAGRSPGVSALDVLDNVVPYIAKEEGKVEAETRKILGRWGSGTAAVEPAPVKLSATCTRVAVQDGHTETVSIGLGRRASLDEVRDALRSWEGSPEARDLPSSAPVDRGARGARSPSAPSRPGDARRHGDRRGSAPRGRRPGERRQAGAGLAQHQDGRGEGRGARRRADASERFPRTLSSGRLHSLLAPRERMRSVSAARSPARRALHTRRRFAAMAYIVADGCVKCKYTDCVEVCPVNCFYEGESMLVIHPDECIDCGACEPVCPTKAIFPESDLPEKWAEYKEINATYSKTWPNISEKKDPLPEAEEFKEKENKRPLLKL